MLLTVATLADPRTWHVSGDYPTIQVAIDNAAANSLLVLIGEGGRQCHKPIE